MATLPELKTKAVEKKEPVTIQGLIEKAAKELDKALPSHMNAERLVRIALTTLRVNPKLCNCEPYSFLGALFQSAQLGLEPNTNGEAWIIPYFNSRSGVTVAQFQVGYQGWIKLFWNHQSSMSLQAETVHRGDKFEYDLGESRVHHVPPDFGTDRGEVLGYYACAHIAGGGRVLKVMSKPDVMTHAKKFSQCYMRKEDKFMPGTPWAEHFDAMGLKTVIKKLMKFVPKSIEVQRALIADESVKRIGMPGMGSSFSGDMNLIPNEAEYPQGQETEKEPQEQAENKPQERIPGSEG